MTEKQYEARVTTFRKEGTRCHLSMRTCEVCAENEDELRAIISEEFEGEDVTIDQIKVIAA